MDLVLDVGLLGSRDGLLRRGDLRLGQDLVDLTQPDPEIGQVVRRRFDGCCDLLGDSNIDGADHAAVDQLDVMALTLEPIDDLGLQVTIQVPPEDVADLVDEVPCGHVARQGLDDDPAVVHDVRGRDGAQRRARQQPLLLLAGRLGRGRPEGRNLLDVGRDVAKTADRQVQQALIVR